MNNEEMWKSINEIVDFYKTEMKKYKDLYYKEKDKYDLLLHDIQVGNYDDFMYRGVKLKDLYEKYIEN